MGVADPLMIFTVFNFYFFLYCTIHWVYRLHVSCQKNPFSGRYKKPFQTRKKQFFFPCFPCNKIYRPSTVKNNHILGYICDCWLFFLSKLDHQVCAMKLFHLAVQKYKPSASFSWVYQYHTINTFLWGHDSGSYAINPFFRALKKG